MRVHLKDLINRSPYSRVELAETLGVSRQTIHSIETQKYCPSVLLALKIAEVLETNINEIFILEEEDL